MIPQFIDPRFTSGGDPLHVLINIKLIRIGKVVANSLHLIAIADFMSAVAAGRFNDMKTSRWNASTVMVWSDRGAGGGEGRAVKPCYLVIFPAVGASVRPVRAHAVSLDARSARLFSAGPTCPTCPTKIIKREE
jgi:hypothetical protein